MLFDFATQSIDVSSYGRNKKMDVSFCLKWVETSYIPTVITSLLNGASFYVFRIQVTQMDTIQRMNILARGDVVFIKWLQIRQDETLALIFSSDLYASSKLIGYQSFSLYRYLIK